MKIKTLVCSIALVIIGLAAGVALTSWYVVNKGTNPVASSNADEIVSAFHRLYHNNWWDRAVNNTYWMGVEAMQCPLDMWVMQEINGVVPIPARFWRSIRLVATNCGIQLGVENMRISPVG